VLSAFHSFSRDQLSLVDRGWTVAIAHIRGGGDMGRKWYEVRQQLFAAGSPTLAWWPPLLSCWRGVKCTEKHQALCCVGLLSAQRHTAVQTFAHTAVVMLLCITLFKRGLCVCLELCAGWQVPPQEEYLHRLHCLRKTSHQGMCVCVLGGEEGKSRQHWEHPASLDCCSILTVSCAA
jgi:hypothetical protein